VSERTAPVAAVVAIRPIRAADLQLEREFVAGLSRTTGYQRLMSTRTPSLEELHRFTEIDRSREAALIATTEVDGRERQVGVARYVKDESKPGEAEFAIVLADAWQGRGLGRTLLASLIDAARRDGVQRLVGTTLSENEGMLRLARRLGFSVALDRNSPSVTNLALELGPP
jgi:RimJ/RimL family protein N-acetyltransferase